jgi:catechol 2,3-dioxygenase-like lactoylglutathione lyase family enzyme
MQYICPLLAVEDIELSKQFYQEVLDQRIKYDLGKNITFEGDFALHEASHFQELLDDKTIEKGSHSFELYFETDFLDDYIERLKENSVEFIHDIKEQPWRQRVIRFYDPDRHIIEVGETMQHLCARLRSEGMNEEEVQQITGLPMEFIEFVFSMNEDD